MFCQRDIQYEQIRCCYAIDNLNKVFQNHSENDNECYIMLFFQNSLRGWHNIMVEFELGAYTFE